MNEKPSSSAWEEVYAVVRRIPSGKVMNYGQISALLTRSLSPAAVGWALRRCPRDVPWQRVVNASGGCSTDSLPHLLKGTQRALLEAEGVEFTSEGKVDLSRFRYDPEADLG